MRDRPSSAVRRPSSSDLRVRAPRREKETFSPGRFVAGGRVVTAERRGRFGKKRQSAA
jgi:hypothetical protein